MTEKLYRSHSLETYKDGENVITSGSLTTWEDNPVSPLNIGDTFKPVENSPELTVEKISIQDNVIGELYGKPVRQWQITIEGSNKAQNNSQQDTHILYNFNISADENSGTMEVSNTGDAPIITLDIGDNFNVPGIGEIPCVGVKGNDSYDDNGVHTWTVTYEGSDKKETSNEIKYNFAIEKNDDEVEHSGSMSVVNTGSAPTLDIKVGSKFSIPGVGNVTCTKVSGSDSYSENGTRIWTVIYEGSNSTSTEGEEGNSYNTTYNFAVEKNSDGDIVHSGSMEVVSSGSSPTISIEVGATFNVPGIGTVTCTKVSGSDNYSDKGSHKWTVVYEGSDAKDSGQSENNLKFSFSIEKNSDGVIVFSGSKEYNTFEVDGHLPDFLMRPGDKISWPVIGEVTCTKISGSNDGSTKWPYTIEGVRYGSSSDGDDEDNNLPETETVTTYEINGITTRSVAGEFIALRRSTTPITKKSITVYSNSANAIANPGTTYEGGIVISEAISKETIKVNNVVTGSYYKHQIEVEA